MSLKPGLIRLLIIECIPLIVKKAFVCLCHQHNSFSFDRICLKLADKVDMDEILDEFENWPDRVSTVRVYCQMVKVLFELYVHVLAV